MRRSRLAFAGIFLAIVSVLYLTHLSSPSTLRDAYQGKWTPPSFSVPGWSSSEKTDYGHTKPADSDDSYSPYTGENEISYQEPSDPIVPPSAPEMLPPSLPADVLPTPAEPVDPAFEDTKYAFQMDLDLPLPTTDLKLLENVWPHNYNPTGGKSFAYAAFMNTHNPSIRDPYFMALQNLIWRVLWSDRARSDRYPFIAFVAEWVTPEQRAILAGSGAIVRELSAIPWHPTDHGIFSRFKDMFAKLHMWNETDFSRILFLDADAFPVTNVDDMFDISAPQQCNRALLEPDDKFPDGTDACEEYVFSGVPQGAGEAAEVNVGAMVLSPSKQMHRRLLQNYQKYDRYFTHMADQGFLSWQFGQRSAFPARLLDRQFDGFMPQQDEKGKLKIVHEKLWASFAQGWLKDEWTSGWKDMIAWYESSEFQALRAADDRHRPLGERQSA